MVAENLCKGFPPKRTRTASVPSVPNGHLADLGLSQLCRAFREMPEKPGAHPPRAWNLSGKVPQHEPDGTGDSRARVLHLLCWLPWGWALAWGLLLRPVLTAVSRPLFSPELASRSPHDCTRVPQAS